MGKKQLDRRDFLRISATSGIGALLMPGASATAADTTVREDLNQIPVRTLGKTGVQLPILGLGVDRPDSNNVLRAAYNAGVKLFDTANGYQNGKNEEMVGAVLKGKPRDSAFVATKIFFSHPLSDNFEKDFNNKLETSLKRLQMDYVDALYIHMATTPEVLKDKRVIAVLQAAKESGKTRFIGFSSHEQKPEIIDAAIEVGVYDIALISYNFKMLNLPELEAAIERGVKAGMGFMTMKAMAGGVEDSEGKKKINAKACLRWIWQNKNITTVVPGLFNYEQLDECLEAAHQPELKSEEQAYLTTLREQEMMYCQRCGQCRAQCPKQLPIPDIMRAYMYAFGYKRAQQSKDTLANLNLSQDICSDCETCLVQCPSGFNVAQKIASVIPVTQIPDVFLA
ncbi:aldo/keto reductase [Bacteroidia bacterium]|nr:aldo/keto reductase [Bacteroidia bacterium]GHV71289.1 aldo/keto reductase [Bacteroidia bacterium]